MTGPYGLELNESCESCKLKGSGFFCQWPETALKDFDAIRFSSVYPAGAILFLEKQAAHGIYVVCDGEVKLSISSTGGKTVILRVAEPGEALGLAATLSGKPHEVTAQTLRPSQVAFAAREPFLRFLRNHPEAYPTVSQQLEKQYLAACEQLRTVTLSNSVGERLARLLLEMATHGEQTKGGTRIALKLTQEEIAELIGTTRESVTRTFSEFKHHNFVALRGATLTIQNRSALEDLVKV